MTNLFGPLDIENWDFIEIWCLGFEISGNPNTQDIIYRGYPSTEYSTVKFHTRVPGQRMTFVQPRTGNWEPLNLEGSRFWLQRSSRASNFSPLNG
jgi:hypothetical protein